jgi:UDP-N-acetylenolpyruvoylglucosamine reductase
LEKAPIKETGSFFKKNGMHSGPAMRLVKNASHLGYKVPRRATSFKQVIAWNK